MNLIKSKKNTFILFVVALLLTNVLTYFFLQYQKKAASTMDSNESASSLYTGSASDCSYKVKRLSGFNYISPLLFVDNECESGDLNPLKQNILSLIDNYKKQGSINSASLYVKTFTQNDWIEINEEEKFFPGSLMKVPELITFLKMNEKNPGVLNKTISFDHPFNFDVHPNILSKSIQLGHSYTIRELLNYMIQYSDNNATALLNSEMDLKIFNALFTDLGLVKPDWKKSNYPITAKEFSLFMRTLYNASYLNIENSEFATELLSKCNYKAGILNSLPSGVKVAHKFGEDGNQEEQQLSESAIIYLDNNPYLITIMTKGRDYKKLPEVIQQISSIVYQTMLTNAKNAS